MGNRHCTILTSHTSHFNTQHRTLHKTGFVTSKISKSKSGLIFTVLKTWVTPREATSMIKNTQPLILEPLLGPLKRYTAQKQKENITSIRLHTHLRPLTILDKIYTTYLLYLKKSAYLGLVPTHPGFIHKRKQDAILTVRLRHNHVTLFYFIYFSK